MGINIVNLACCDPGRSESILNRPNQAYASRMRDCDIMAIACLSPSEQLCVRFDAPTPNFVFTFKNKDRSTSSANKAISLLVKRTRRPLGFTLQRQRPHTGKRHDTFVVYVLTRSNKHSILPSRSDVIKGVSQSVPRRGAGR